MDPFSRFGIDHLSASSLNMYAEEPAFWALVYLHGHKDEAGPAAWRGSAVESGVDYWLYKRDLQGATKAANTQFETKALGDLTENVDTERKLIPRMLGQACEALQGRQEPTARQLKIEHWFEGIEVPLIGFIDYEFGEEGFDLKSTRRMPNLMPPRHCRQLSLYQAARKKPYRGLYVTDKKWDIKNIDEPETHVKRLEWYAHSVRRLLSVFPDKHDAARIFAPNFEHAFYWKHADSRALAKEIWE